MRPFTYLRPDTVAAALAAATDTSRYLGGGSNLVDLMKKHIAEPESVVDVAGALPDKIEFKRDGVRLGALASNSAVAGDTEIKQRFPLLAKALLAGATPQIRNMATVGGNPLQRTRCPYFYATDTPCNKREPGTGCSAIKGDNRISAVVGYSDECVAVHPSDFCIALVALDAVVEIVERDGKARSIPFRDFHRLPGETPQFDTVLPKGALITHISVPANPFGQHVAYIKVRDRDSYAFALVSVAAALELDGTRIKQARLASGGVAHKPWRWDAAEIYLRGKPATADSFREAARLVTEGLQPLEHNTYKLPMLRGAVELALQTALTATA